MIIGTCENLQSGISISRNLFFMEFDLINNNSISPQQNDGFVSVSLWTQASGVSLYRKED
jgi:hypothetical protein